MVKRIMLMLLSSLASAILVFGLCACSGVSALTKDASVETDWGTIVRFKVGSEWMPAEKLDPSDTNSVHYSGQAGNSEVMVRVENPGVPAPTYAAWEAWMTTSSDQGQAASNGSPYPDPEYYPSNSNFSLEQIGTGTIDGNDCRLYRVSYTMTYANQEYERLKEYYPDLKRDNDITEYTAVILDGVHFLEVTANTEEVLNAVLPTVTIQW